MLRWMASLSAIMALATATVQAEKITIFHTNDIHGHFMAEPVVAGSDTVMMGGIPAIQWYLDSLRALYPVSMYLDAGDLMTGHPICNIEYHGARGGALLELLHRCGLTAITLGNHEFDLGPDALHAYISSSPVPVLSANVLDKSNHQPLADPARIFSVGNLRVAVIGLMMDNLAESVSQWAITPFEIADAAKMAQTLIDSLDSGSDLIVLLTHNGIDNDSVLAGKIHGADLIVGGHSHTLLPHPVRVNNVLIVQAGSYAKRLGVLNLDVSGDSIAAYDGRLIELKATGKANLSRAAQLADSLDRAIRQDYDREIGRIGTPWVRSYYGGSNVGNWICDRLREQHRADIALINSGGIRADLPAGPVTLLDVEQLVPFLNHLAEFRASGDELMKIAVEQARAQGLHEHGALEMSGLAVDYRIKDNQPHITALLVNGKPLKRKASYRIVSIDYVAASQWQKYLGFKPRDLQIADATLKDFVAQAIRETKRTIIADETPRLQEKP